METQKRPGFLEHSRKLPEPRPIEERLRDFRDLYPPQEEQETRNQASRCMDCGVPFCHQGCPLGNQIPDLNALVRDGRWREAYIRLASTNNFPELTGRLCPAPCEAACVLGINRPAVAIEQIEKEVIERAFAEGWVRPRHPRVRTAQRVAVVGSGPAGLAAAAQLNSVGHQVSVYEAADRVGGLLRYGVPDFKLEKWVIDRRVDILKAEGIEFITGTSVGSAISWTRLRDLHDAVLVTIGAQRPRDLDVPGRELEGVCFAMDFLVQQNRELDGLIGHKQALSATGKKVIILGGGDTGSDCLGTALRQGATSVHQIELLPAPPHQRGQNNPWPQWPLIYRTSSSHEEGGTREFAMLTKRLSGQEARLSGLHAVRVELEGGELREVPGSELELPVDLLILALGFEGPQVEQLRQQLGVALDRHNNVKVDRRFSTNVDGVYAAGDAKRGASLVVWALSEGREAARAIDAYLQRGESALSTRGQDHPFGGV
jgi:glutamate synthase (NADPH/NADH) small chain